MHDIILQPGTTNLVNLTVLEENRRGGFFTDQRKIVLEYQIEYK
jgi:hypothetical protein